MLLFHLVAFHRHGHDQMVRAWTVSRLQKCHVEQHRLGRNAPCAEAAQQKVRAKCADSRSTFASMRNTDSESDTENNTNTDSVIVDECADSVYS